MYSIQAVRELAAILLGLGAWGVITLLERSEEAAKAPLATPKDWSEVTPEALADTKFTLRTIWRDGNIYYQFRAHGYPPAIAKARESSASAAFIIDFLDGDGFRLFQKVLKLREMTRAVGSDRKTTRLSWKGDEYLGADLYRRAESWELRWSGFPEVKVAVAVEKRTTKGPPLKRFQPENSADKKPSVTTKAPPKPVTKKEPKWKVLARWRTLYKGKTKPQVTRTLGEPDKVEELGFATWWYYGYPLGGRVVFDATGNLESWSEPNLN